MDNDSRPPPAEPTGFRVDDLIVDLGRRRITRGDAELQLSSLSFDLLLELFRSAPNIVSYDQLMKRVWPGLVVGPETITQRVKVVREALGDDAAAPRYIAGVRGRGYRLLATVTPLDQSAVVERPAPAIEPAASLTPAPPAAPRHVGRARLAYAGVAVVGLLIAYAAGERSGWLRGASPGQREPAVQVQGPVGRSAAAGASALADKSIAVMPFVDLSEQRNQEYFSDGLAEELIDLLSKLPGLQVSSRTSSFYFKGQRTTIADVARALRVTNVLEGSVRRSGNRVRVSAQLIRADNGYQRWSQSYDRQLDDIFKVQDEIAGAVAQALKVELQAGALSSRATPPRMETYTLALQGRYFLERHTPEDFDRAADYYRRALELDSGYAPAWAGFAQAIWIQGDLGKRPWGEARASARDAAEHAIHLEPQSSAAHVVMSKLLAVEENWSSALSELDTALASEPGNSSALIDKAALTSVVFDRGDAAIRLSEQAVAHDPLRPSARYKLCWIYFEGGRAADADDACRQALELSPNYVGAHFTLALHSLARGESDAAFAEVMREPGEAFRLLGIAIIQHRVGRKAESAAALATLTRQYPKRMLFIAAAHAHRGELDAAFEWLERARAQRENQLYEIKWGTMFGPLRRDPRYRALLTRMRLP